MPSTFKLLSRVSSVFDTTAGWRAILHAGRLLLVAGAVALLSDCSSRGPIKPTLHRVTIRGFKFDPDSLSIAAGDTVEWLNKDIVPHTSTARSSHWDSQSIQPNDSWRVALTIRGSEPYGCQLHLTMKAKLVVR